MKIFIVTQATDTYNNAYKHGGLAFNLEGPQPYVMRLSGSHENGFWGNLPSGPPALFFIQKDYVYSTAYDAIADYADCANELIKKHRDTISRLESEIKQIQGFVKGLDASTITGKESQ